MVKALFSGLVALILLGLYVYSIDTAIHAAQCLSEPNCQAYTKDLNEGVVTVLSLVGGLVSALVVAELAVTQPGKPPAARLLAPNPSDRARQILTVVSILYVVVWLVFGLRAFIVGSFQHPNVVPALTAAGKSWLGLAVASAYSFFGITPPDSGGSGS